jgi:hypothetical protein
MSVRLTLAGLALACATAIQSPPDGRRRVQLDLPLDIPTRHTHLLLRSVAVPRNRAIVLRAYALLADSAGRVFLGSAGIPAIAPEASGVTALPEVRINVTTGLRRWLAVSGSPTRVTVEIVAAAGADTTAAPISWTLRDAAFVQLR